jgi:hypothetical protein
MWQFYCYPRWTWFSKRWHEISNKYLGSPTYKCDLESMFYVTVCKIIVRLKINIYLIQIPLLPILRSWYFKNDKIYELEIGHSSSFNTVVFTRWHEISTKKGKKIREQFIFSNKIIYWRISKISQSSNLYIICI